VDAQTFRQAGSAGWTHPPAGATELSTSSFLDQNLRSLLGAGAQADHLRPSVIRSEFFHDYSLRRILEAPQAAWFDLQHTRGVGGKSIDAIAQVVGQELAARFPKEWALAEADGASDEGAEWPVGALAEFIAVWVNKTAP
jgi:hypothetical protein